MKEHFLTVYTRSLRIKFHRIDAWHPFGIFKTIALSLGFRIPQKSASVYINGKILPGGRFAWIRRWNETLFRWTVKNILTSLTPQILWIRNPYWFALHNGIKTDVLILSCAPEFLPEISRNMMFREYFAAGWVFAYRLAEVNETVVFKRRDEAAIIDTLHRWGKQGNNNRVNDI